MDEGRRWSVCSEQGGEMNGLCFLVIAGRVGRSWDLTVVCWPPGFLSRGSLENIRVALSGAIL